MFKKPQVKSKVVVTKIEPELYKSLQQLIKKHDITLSFLIRELLAEYAHNPHRKMVTK